ncbi:MAG: DUF4469 domain-containing protein [Spirochaetaceae bacterium]|nr:DUF4469 domain-containing protein [Spirochaetaceae bacterium]
MSDIYAVKERMHKMRAKLYPSYLLNSEGAYIARTANEASVSTEDICASMKNRGGYDGDYEEAVKTIRHFHLEMLYQLADGFSANLGFFSVHPNIGGTFTNEKEAHDHKKHPVNFRFQALKPMRDLRDEIEVIIEGVADTSGYIMEFLDIGTGAINETYTNMNQFIITGYKLKVAGDDPEVGIYFEQVGGPTKLKVTSLAENTSSKLIGMIPGGPNGTYKVVIKTQYSGSGSAFLKTPRVIESGFTLSK